MSTKLNGHKQTATSYRVCLFEQEPNPLDAEEGEDTDTLTTTDTLTNTDTLTTTESDES